MLSLSAAQQTAAALESKIVKWGFTITDNGDVEYAASIGQVFSSLYETAFSSDTGWILNNGAAIAGGVLTFGVDASATHWAYRTSGFGMDAGTLLRFTYTVVSNNAEGLSSFVLYGDASHGITNTNVALDSTVGTHSVQFNAGNLGDRNYFEIVAVGAITAGSLVIDDVMLEEIVEDDLLLMDFSGITLNRNLAENTVIAPSDVSFTISNPETALDFPDFKGGKVLIDLYISDGIIDTKMASWLFRIKTAQPGYQKLMIVAEDFLQSYLEGYYPNTRYPQDIFPSNRSYNNKSLCVPVPFGTAYVPLRDVFITDDGFIVLGDPTYTYTISKLRSPRSEGSKVEWDSGSYDFNQYTKADADAVDWRVFQAIIADVDTDGTADAHGCWSASGGLTQDPPVKFTRSDTATITDFPDVISFVLQDFGIPSANIDIAGTFASVKTTLAALGLTCNGAFWYKQKREAVLAQLLTMCHCCLQVGEKIELHILSKTSQKTITATEVLRTVEQGEGTFQYQDIVSTDLSDSGYVAYQEADEAQDELVKVLVGINGASTVVSNSVVECPFVQDSQDVKRIGILHFQRLLGKAAQVSFTSKGTCFGLQPDNVITLDEANYGGTYDVLIDSVKINEDLSLNFVCSKYSVDFDDWGDLSPSELSIPADTVVSAWKPAMSGPDSDGDVNALPDRIRIGTGTNYIVFDPADPLRISLYVGGVEKIRLGNLNGFLDFVSNLYGLAGGTLTDFIKIDASSGTVGISADVTIGNPEDINTADLTNDAGWTDDTAANAAQGDATQALADAADAQTDATTALGELDDIASDAKITPVEKLTLKPMWDAIVTEATLTTGTLPIQAASFSVDDSAFDSAYATLYAYVITSLDTFGNMTTTTDITRATWDAAFKGYYDARTDLLNAIAAKAKDLADTAQGAADDAQDTADLKINVFHQAGIPTSLAIGDLWFDSDDGNKAYRAASVGSDAITAGEWEEIELDIANFAGSLDDIADGAAYVKAPIGWKYAATTKIDGGEIYTGTIVAGAINVATLAAIVADLGSVTAGQIVVGSTNKIWLNDGDDGQFAIGGSTKADAPFRVEADGTTHTLTGDLDADDFIQDGTVITPHVADDNITRIWSYDSDVSVILPEWVIVFNMEYSMLTYTASFTPNTTYEMMVWGKIASFADGKLNDTTDRIRFIFALIDNLEVVNDGVYKWTASGSGTNEYYLTDEAGTSSGLSAAPMDVYEDAVSGGGTALVRGSVGSLTAGKWDWDDNDTLGFNTIYVRLTDSSNPDGKTDGYVRAGQYLQSQASPYYSGYMAYSQSIRDNSLLIFLHTFADTKKRSLAIVGAYELLNGSLAAGDIEAIYMNMIVLERKGK